MTTVRSVPSTIYSVPPNRRRDRQRIHPRFAAAPDIVWRKLWPADRAEIAAHLRRLPPGDRRMRFMGFVGDAVIDRYTASLDWRHSVLTGCFIDGVLRGLAHLALTESPDEAAEIGISVEPSAQRRGIGTELLRRSLLSARNRFAATVVMHCLDENRKMRLLASKFTDEVAHAGNELRLMVRQDGPDALSQTQESAADAIALARALFDPAMWFGNVRTAR